MAKKVSIGGIEVSKEWLDVWVDREELGLDVARDAEGLALLADWLAEHDVEIVGIEATGGYERAVIDALQARGLRVRLLNPLRVRRFAQAAGRRAKNDRIDVKVIARFTATFDEDRPPRDRALRLLAEHVTLRQQLIEQMTALAGALEHLDDPGLRRMAGELRRLVERRRDALDRRIGELIAAQSAWAELSARLRSVPGIGTVVAAMLIARLPELGHVGRREIASLVGLAPYDDDSGKHRG